MALLTLVCSHCGSERYLPPPVPAPNETLACTVCRHAATYAEWVSRTEREIAALTLDRIHDVSSRSG